jgi:hypothetical protein
MAQQLAPHVLGPLTINPGGINRDTLIPTLANLGDLVGLPDLMTGELALLNRADELQAQALAVQAPAAHTPNLVGIADGSVKPENEAKLVIKADDGKALADTTRRLLTDAAAQVRGEAARSADARRDEIVAAVREALAVLVARAQVLAAVVPDIGAEGVVRANDPELLAHFNELDRLTVAIDATTDTVLTLWRGGWWDAHPAGWGAPGGGDRYSSSAAPLDNFDIVYSEVSLSGPTTPRQRLAFGPRIATYEQAVAMCVARQDAWDDYIDAQHAAGMSVRHPTGGWE